MGDGKTLKIPRFFSPKSFEVKHTHASIVLGSCPLQKKTKTIVELGCGNGVVLVLIALLNPFVEKLIGVDVNPKACEVAREFVKLNSLENRIKILNTDIKDVRNELKCEMADLVVFNPPFHISGKVSVEKGRFLERNANVFESFVDATRLILKNKGIFRFVTSPNNILTYFEVLLRSNMIPKYLTPVYGKRGVESKLALIEGTKNGNLPGFRIKEPVFLDKIETFAPLHSESA